MRRCHSKTKETEVVRRITSLAKTIMQSTVQGGRKRGRQKKRLVDNIQEWTDVSLAVRQPREMSLAGSEIISGLSRARRLRDR